MCLARSNQGVWVNFRKNKDGWLIAYKVLDVYNVSPYQYNHTWALGVNQSSRTDAALREEESEHVSDGFHLLARKQDCREIAAWLGGCCRVIRVLVEPRDVVTEGTYSSLNGAPLRALVCTKCLVESLDSVFPEK